MEIYREKIQLEKEVPASGIVRIMQDMGGAHNRCTGLSRQVLREKGLFWIIVSNYINIERYPEPEEELEIITWRGRRKRTLLPRYLIGKDKGGNIIFRASALWAMADAESHKMVNPLKFGLDPQETVTGQECRLPGIIKPVKTEHECSFEVPQEYIDSNHHMNNTRYFDMCEQCLADKLQGKKLREADIDYISEAVLSETIKVSWAENGAKTYIQGEEKNTVFRMNFKYE